MAGKILCRTGHYTVCAFPRFFVVQAGVRGVQMKDDHPQYADFLQAFEEAAEHKDNYEINALCKALLQ